MCVCVVGVTGLFYSKRLALCDSMCSMNAFMAATLERLSTGSCDQTKLGANTTARLEEVILLRHDESMTCVIKQSNQIQPSVNIIEKSPVGASNIKYQVIIIK